MHSPFRSQDRRRGLEKRTCDMLGTNWQMADVGGSGINFTQGIRVWPIRRGGLVSFNFRCAAMMKDEG